MNKHFYTSLILLVITTFVSCDTEKIVQEKVKVARVGSVYLYQEELIKDIQSGLSKEDSLLFIDQLISNWIEEQIVLQKAEEVLPQEAKDVKDRLENYRKSLIIFAYEQKFIKERLDTAVSPIEVEEYYAVHKDDFMLKDYIVKALYLKISKGTPDIEKPQLHFKLEQETDLNEMRYYADLYAVQFHYDPEQWLFFEDVLKVIPLEGINTESFLRKKKKTMFEDENFIYFINITDFTLKDAISPLSFEKEKIKTILLNLRTIDLRNKLREDLSNDAIKDQQVETY
jgi:hypothetical protein